METKASILNKQLEIIIQEVNKLNFDIDVIYQIDSLDNINGLLIDFLNEIHQLPEKEFSIYNEKIKSITPKLESFILSITEYKNKMNNELKNSLNEDSLYSKINTITEDA